MTPVAALWIRALSGPRSATSRATRSEETFPRTSRGSAPAARTSSAVASAALSFRRYPIATRAAPSSANRSAIAFPIPRDPPVTKTEAPSKLTTALGTVFQGLSLRPDRTSFRARQRLGRRRRARQLVPARHVAPDAAAGFGPRGRMPEPVEELHLLLAVAPHRVVFREVLDEFLDPSAELVGELWSGRPDERVDGLFGGLGHRKEPNG